MFERTNKMSEQIALNIQRERLVSVGHVTEKGVRSLRVNTPSGKSLAGSADVEISRWPELEKLVKCPFQLSRK